MGRMLVIGALAFSVWAAQELTPDIIRHTQAGTQAQHEGKYDVAIAEFQKVVELKPDLASGYASLGAAYFKKGDYDAAIQALQRAVDLNANLLGAQESLGAALLMQGNAEAALPHLEKTRDPGLLGMAYLETGKVGDALSALQNAIQQKPNDPDLLYYFGKAAALASVRAFDQVIATAPNSARAHEARGDRMAEEGRARDAGHEYFEALKLAPGMPGLHLAMARLLMSDGRWDAAAREFSMELALRPASAEARYGAGTALLQQGKASEAMAELEKANALRPNSPNVLFTLGRAAALAGDKSRAEQLWTKVVELDKSGRLANEAQTELKKLKSAEQP
jgi:tetratricopeptide (TPR) repeat protein